MKHSISGHNILKLVAAAFIVLFVIMVFFLFSAGNKIKNGVKIEGVSFSGYTKQEAMDRLNKIYLDKLKNSAIILSYKNKTWEIPYKEINARFDLESAVEKAFNIGRDEGTINNFFDSIAILIKGCNVRVVISYDKNKLNSKVKELEKIINSPGKDAAIVVEKDNSLRIVPEQSGLKLEVDKAVQLIEDNISSASNSIIQLPVQIDLPKYTAEQLKEINAQIGYGRTNFNSGEKNRSANIRNALARINGTILLPGEVFSLNTVLGPRSEKNGYMNAPVILNDELVPGVGGGVCQVATTLYKSVLEGCFKVVERQHHTFPPAYVPVGQDATIAGNYIDFKFRNNTDYPLFISAQAPKSSINIKIYTKVTLPVYKVKIESQVLEVEDPGPDEIIQDSSIPVGETKVERQAKKGYKVAVYRNIYEAGKLIKRELVSNDYYKPIRGNVKIGTGVVEPEKDVMIQDYLLLPNKDEKSIEEPDNPPDMDSNWIRFN